MKGWYLWGVLVFVLMAAVSTVIACGDDDDDDDDNDDDENVDDDSADDDDEDDLGASCDEPVEDAITDCDLLCTTENCEITLTCQLFGDQTPEECLEGCQVSCEAGCIAAGLLDCLENYTDCDSFEECAMPFLEK